MTKEPFFMFLRKYSIVITALATALILLVTPAVAYADDTAPVKPEQNTYVVVIYEELPNTTVFLARQGTPRKWDTIEVTQNTECSPCWNITLPENVTRFRTYDTQTGQSTLYAPVRVEPTGPLLALQIPSKVKNWKPPARLLATLETNTELETNTDIPTRG